ncbi:spermatogenesis-associated protein 22 isoform X1 [Pyxicephalus adspersus]|uniref:spermatogenesis-associated protein 22 isoform X1 n=1 Tax=Pyxicephalus adspersus TaxID=30357 RepID=UPI003B5CCA11
MSGKEKLCGGRAAMSRDPGGGGEGEGNMKRRLPACLPVPIFNQKKRNRQPLTSVPQKNEGFGFAPESFEFSSMATGDSDSTWTSKTYPANNAAKTVDCSLQVPRPSLHAPFNQQYKPNSPGMSSFWFGDENVSHTSKDLNLYRKRNCGQMQMSDSSKARVNNNDYAPPVYSPHQLSKQTYTSSSKRLQYSFVAPSRSKDLKGYKMRKDDEFDDMPEEEMVQALPLNQITLKEKRITLRVITVSIESMKHWNQYTDQTPLLFELLAVLDSAVTSGSHGSKLFILRDGKNHVQCVFYEIDRELPRLIRGRVHRVMGNYDKVRNQLKCVSVRPATAAEQQTFTEFVTAASIEMEEYVKKMNKM